MGKRANRKKFDTQGENDSIVRDIGTRKKFTPHDLVSIQPKTYNQKRFIESFFNNVPILAGIGCPGVGKSFLSLYCALSDVLDESTPHDRIVLIRSSVQGRNIGFLPGTIEEKDEVYEMPYHSIVRELMPSFQDGYDHLKALGYLEFHNTSFLRSATFDRSIIIVSEAQNLDYAELSTCITRAGIHSKVIIEGDSSNLQNDLSRQREKSGLDRFVRVLENMDSNLYDTVRFDHNDIVRSPLVKAFIIADMNTP